MVYVFSYGSTPTYVQLENCPSFPFTHTKTDQPIKSIMQNGYTMIRPRFTKERSTYSLSWLYLSETDKKSLEDMETALLGVTSFTWYYEYPSSTSGANSRTVVLDKAITYDLQLKTKESSFWNVKLSISDI